MDQYVHILYDILSKTADHFLHEDFDKEIIQRFYDYYNSSYSYLVQMYPVYFMQISFYEKYIQYGYGCVNIYHFNYYFMPYQKHQQPKYHILLTNLYRKVKWFDPVDDLSDQMFDISLN
jgi:hypothetical protein